MSVREDIAVDLVQKLQDTTDPVAIRYVSRQPITSVDLSIEQYPAIFIRTGQEDRSDQTMSSSNTRFGVIDFTITGFVRVAGEENIDTKRNELIEAIEEKIEQDRKRNNLALNSTVTNVTTDEGDQFPIGRIDMNYQVTYKYSRGTL